MSSGVVKSERIGRTMRNPHFLLDGFGVVATNCSRSGSALNENTCPFH
jgi:hypothetical protein